MSIKTESNIYTDTKHYLTEEKNLIDNHLKKLFTGSDNYKDPKKLWDAIRYSLLDGGKRIRGILCLATYKSIKVSEEYLEDCLTTACSIELIHAMSLIHDDLPSMDNDDLRRGKPSCHKAFGEATAILAGDAMLSLAFQLIAENTKKISDIQKLELIKTLSKSFTFGLVPGQILDLSNIQDTKNDLEIIKEISILKTAELIRASVLCGAIIALDKIVLDNSKKKILDAIDSFGLKIGTAFQIIDDILDVTGDTKTLGKTSGKDEKQKKLTYPLAIGVKNSTIMARNLIIDAKSELKDLPIQSSILLELSDYIVNRIN